MRPPGSAPVGFRRRLMRWYRASGRHRLPWRLTRDPYAILVSEVMLQRTQVDRVAPYYTRWLERWPTVQSLAGASPAEVIREWAGLGYNRRALYLHRSAVATVEQHGGALPRNVSALRKLPGIGPYTAAAVACFAFGQSVAATDTNVARVIARSRLGVASQRESTSGAISAGASALLPARGARAHNLALMDLGALVCTSRSPSCDACPLRRDCAWLAAGRPPGVTANYPAPRFETTARYARGRIIAALRKTEHLSTADLLWILPAHHRSHVQQYLAALVGEGLVVEAAEGWSLPARIVNPES